MTGTAATSLVALMRARLDTSYDRPAVCDALDQGRTWAWGELIAAAVDLADRFDAVGLRRGHRLAHLGSHSPDWIVVDLACHLAGIVHVPLHADATAAEHASQLAWLAPHGIAWSGCCRREHVEVDIPIVIDLRTVHPSPHHRFSTGGRDAGLSDAGVLRSAGWHRRHADRAALCDAVSRCVAACDPDACSTILLSSGTTGRPKGVLHSQRAVVANAVAATKVFLDEPDDVRLSWLPLSHSLARTGDLVTALVRGGCLNVVTDRRRVLDACRVLPPTVVLGVPAFFERLERATESGRIPDLPAALGGRVRVCVSGGAALRERTAAAFSSRGLPLVQGYGLAEAGPVVAVANPRIARPGTVGPPLDGVELKLDTRPATLGQLLVRTPGRALGVIGDEPAGQGSELVPHSPDELHAEAVRIDSQWLETGDLAAIDADGHVRITGRIVDTLVLSGGTKVPPAEVEAALAEDPVVAQVCVVGDGLAAPVALVVPEPSLLRAALRRTGVRVLSRRAALRNPRVLRWLGRRLARRQRQLPRGFRVRRAVLIGRAFDAAHGEATESLKLRRTVIAAHFAKELAAAAEPVPPSWIAMVSAGPPCGLQHADATGSSGGVDMTTRSSWAASSVWGGSLADATTPSGFSLAAAQAAEPPRAAIADVVERAGRVIAELRAQSRLYAETPPGIASTWSSAPLDDAPAAPVGKFAQGAETAIGATGLWGLLVPERFGGTGCTMQELARVITRFAADVPTAAGMLSVHSSIGAVSAVTAFGSESQQARHLPGLAQGRPLSIFGATEPDAGCDLHAIRSRLERHEDRLLLSGTKMFITGATYGRLVKLLVLLDGRPTVLLVRLPDADTPSFRLRHYGLHPLKHSHNAAIEFTRHEVDESDILQPPGVKDSDAMRIVWHGLNRGRITLAAQAAGTLRLLLRQARDHALRRRTWGEPIASRELIQGRLARIAAGVAACDSLASWAAAAIDAGQSGELEAITAKIVAGECVREGAINSLGVHGGRAFLVGHPLGDSFHDHFAVTVYEGESDLLGLALFKGLAKHHPLAHLARESSSGRRAAAWLAWRIGRFGRRPHHDDSGLLDRRLRDHAAAARHLLDRAAIRIDRGIRRQGRALADRQLLVGSWSAEVRDLVSVLAVAHHADATSDDDVDLQAADCWCRLALARARGRRLTASDHAALASLGRMAVDRPA